MISLLVDPLMWEDIALRGIVLAYGSADMSGNVWEWTSSHYFSFPYRSNDRQKIRLI